MSIPSSQSRLRNEEKNILHARDVVVDQRSPGSGNGSTQGEKQERSNDLNASTLNVERFFPRTSKKKPLFESISDYCRWGISLAGIASKMGYETASGALKFLQKLSDKISIDRVFDFFQPRPTDIIHLDEVVSHEGGNNVYRWFARGSNTNKVTYAWGVSKVRNFLFASAMINMTIRHNHKDPKIWVSDGLTEYHTSLTGHYGKEQIRTVFMGKTMENDIIWMTTDEKKRVFSISKDKDFLVISQGLSEPQEVYRTIDCRHYTTTIETILSLFHSHNASCVFIQAFEKTLPFREFSKRFLEHTQDDHFSYHFIGHATNGNTMAEIFSRRIAHRLSWHNELTQSTVSSRKIFNLQMIIYNMFTKLKCLANRSPFEAEGVRLESDENTWNALLNLS